MSKAKTWMQKLARSLAAGYSRTFGVDFEDVEQQALVIMLRAEQSSNYNHALGGEAFCFTAAKRSLLSYCIRQVSPISCHNDARMGELFHKRSVDLDTLTADTGPSTTDEERRYHETHWPERVRAVVYGLVGTDAEIKAALQVIIGEITAYDAATSLGVHASAFYPVIRRVREDLASSRELWAVWKERT